MIAIYTKRAWNFLSIAFIFPILFYIHFIILDNYISRIKFNEKCSVEKYHDKINGGIYND